MKFIKKSNPAHLLHNALSLISAFIYLLGLLIVISFFLHMVKPEKKKIDTFNELGLKLYEDTIELPEDIKILDEDKIIEVSGIYNFELKADSRIVISIQFLFHAGLILIIIFIIRNIQDIILSLDKDGPFTFKNIKRMKNIVFLFWGIVGVSAVYAILNFIYISTIIEFSNVQPYFDLISKIFSDVVYYVAVGLIIMVIAQVFEKGLKLQQENELTV